MDHYPEVNISERECSSGRNSTASSITNSHKSSLDHPSRHSSHLAPPQFTSFPPPSDASEQQRTRNDSVHSNRSNHDSKSQEQSPATVLEKELARFTEAPPPYSPKAYEGKSEDEKTRMKMVDYARGISRMMGRQLVRGLKSKESGGK